MAKRLKVMEGAIAALLFAGIAGMALAQGPAGAIDARKAAMKAIGGTVPVLRNPESTPAALKAAGKTINDSLKTFAANVGPGTGPDSGIPTKAKAEMWSDSAGFQDALASALSTSAALANADDATAKDAAAKVFPSACGGCHTKYRAT